MIAVIVDIAVAIQDENGVIHMPPGQRLIDKGQEGSSILVVVPVLSLICF